MSPLSTMPSGQHNVFLSCLSAAVWYTYCTVMKPCIDESAFMQGLQGAEAGGQAPLQAAGAGSHAGSLQVPSPSSIYGCNLTSPLCTMDKRWSLL